MTEPTPGIAKEIEDGVRCLLAPNPGPMTHRGTNTWIVGGGDLAVIDPGPDDADHLEALLAATRGQTISHILVTHAHVDHSGLAPRLARHTGAEVIAYGPPEAGRSPVMERLSTEADLAGGEGIDTGFVPGRSVGEGDRIAGPGWHLEVLHTPGHFAGHLSFRMGDVLFSGDHLMDWATTIVSPPDGDVADFMATSRRLIDLAPARCLTGHGGVIRDPADRLSELIAHRQRREAEILDALAAEAATVAEITDRIYADIPVGLKRAAERNVLAHLIDLEARNAVRASPKIGLRARFELG